VALCVNHMRALLSVAAMLTLAPISAVTTLVAWQPDRWGGSLNPLNIVAMSIFGLLTVPLWPTYIPAVVLTPVLMKRVAAHQLFTKLPLPALIGLSLLAGATGGACVLGLFVLLSLEHSGSPAMNWTVAGAVSGALTLTLGCLSYRYPSQNVAQDCRS
jgi:hypothetical protein